MRVKEVNDNGLHLYIQGNIRNLFDLFSFFRESEQRNTPFIMFSNGKGVISKLAVWQINIVLG